MDLSTVAANLHKGIIKIKGKYKDHLEFAKDMRKIWSNSF